MPPCPRTPDPRRGRTAPASQGFSATGVRVALVLARLREAEGRNSDAISFATYGLEHAIKALGLRSELERIAALPNNPVDRTC
jgi:hypothetical protein